MPKDMILQNLNPRIVKWDNGEMYIQYTSFHGYTGAYWTPSNLSEAPPGFITLTIVEGKKVRRYGLDTVALGLLIDEMSAAKQLYDREAEELAASSDEQ